MSAAISSQPERPLLAIVTGHLPPYREHFHRRIAREIPEIRLASLVTKFRSGPWINPSVPEIGTVMFEPEDHAPGSLIARFVRERRKGVAVARWLDEQRPGAVLIIGYDEIPNLDALRWARRHGVPTMMWADSNARGDRARGIKRLAKSCYVPWICRKLSRVLVCGSAGEAFFARYGVPASSMTRVPVEPEYALIERMTSREAYSLAAEAGIASFGGRRLVCCCRLVAEKRVDLVIDAFEAIADERPEWELLIVGDGVLRADLEIRAGKLVHAGRVRFLGFQDQRHVTGVYLTSHILVLASEYEPWALVINEACAAGLRILASDRVGAAIELVRDGVNGRLVPAGDLDALVRAMRACTDASCCESLRARSREQIVRWRRDADPVAGLRSALVACGTIPPGPDKRP